MQDITEQAGVAAGLFYRYFGDLRQIVAEVIGDFFSELLKDPPPMTGVGDPYDWIYQNHRIVVTGFAKNPGILACLFGLAGDYEEFEAIWKRNAHVWNLQVAAFVRQYANLSKDAAERMGFVLGAMTEGVIFQSLIRRTDDLLELGSSPNDIAEFISVMWYRAIFLKDPAGVTLRGPGRRLISRDRGRAANRNKGGA